MEDNRLSRRAVMRLFSWSSVATLLGCGPTSGTGEGRRVLVLGAGVAGLSAAHELRKAGYEVTVLEGRERVGGRVYTHRDGFEDGQFAEIGAVRVGSSHTQVLAYADELGLELDEFPDGEPVYHLEGTRFIHKEGEAWPISGLHDDELTQSLGDMTGRYIYDYIDEFGDPSQGVFPGGVVEAYDALTYSAYLELRGASPGFLKIYAADQGTEIYKIGALAWMMAEAIDYDWVETYHIRGGNDRLPARLAEEVGDERILLGHKVTRIEGDESSVTVTAEHDGAEVTFTAEFLVCTIPFAVLRGIMIDAPLAADKREAIDGHYLQNAARGYIQTQTRFWEKEGIGGRQIAKTDLPIERIWDLSAVQDPSSSKGMITTYTQYETADAYCALSPDEREALIMKHTAEVFPEIEAEKVAFFHYCWREDPWALGAWTDFLPGAWWTFAVNRRVEGRIHFAGEHTSAWAGWMEGGVESGQRAAQEIMDRTALD